LYATGVTRVKGVGLVLRRIGGRGHFRSRDKDVGYTILSAILEKPLLYANITSTVCLNKTSPTFLAVTREIIVGFS